jgi:hypothetical protein
MFSVTSNYIRLAYKDGMMVFAEKSGSEMAAIICGKQQAVCSRWQRARHNNQMRVCVRARATPLHCMSVV